MGTLLDIGLLAGIGLLCLIAIGFVLARLYRRASKEVAYVRTGMGGPLVIMDGGAIVLPVFHEIISVNLNTLKLEVERRETESLIAKDRMRVDVVAAFFVRVKQTAEAVSTAAQTLGQRTLHPDALKALVEDKFVDALRATAATMTMQELQDKRREFVQQVQNAVTEDLEKNGLELESVSLTKLDQTDRKFFNPNNAFDAEGLTRLTEEVEARRKQRNDVEQNTEVQVQSRNLEANREKLKIAQEQEFASLQQRREIENAKSDQSAQIAQRQSERYRESEEARIEADRLVKQKTILADQAVRTAQIENSLVVQTKEIEAKQKTDMQLAEQRRFIEIANQDTQIAISNKSREQSEAQARANEALAEAARSDENVRTAREVAMAERERQIQLIEAEKTAQQSAIAVKVAAAADKAAAADRAEALKVEAEAKQTAAMAEAAGKRAINEALNTLSAAQIDLIVRQQLLSQLPNILQKALTPMEKIDSIRIFQVNGLPGHNAEGTTPPSAHAGSLPDQVVSSALKYQVMQPLVNAIMRDAGLGANGVQGIGEALAQLSASPKADTTLN